MQLFLNPGHDGGAGGSWRSLHVGQPEHRSHPHFAGQFRVCDSQKLRRHFSSTVAQLVQPLHLPQAHLVVHTLELRGHQPSHAGGAVGGDGAAGGIGGAAGPPAGSGEA